MAYIIVDAPENCWKKNKPESCKECYFSQVNENNQWKGSQKCFNAGCLKYGGQK